MIRIDCEGIRNLAPAVPDLPESDGKCEGKWGGTCVFPWHHPVFGELLNCQDSVDKLTPHEPWCQTEFEGLFDQCKFDANDADCMFHD